MKKPDDTLTEVTVADKLEEFRRKQKDFVSLSFDTISSVGPNGSIIHYKPETKTCSKVVKNEIYLCDSGAQYKDGTTDVTRTHHFGEPTSHQKRCFTRVLQGHISLASVIFPAGTCGFQLDFLARKHLWLEGLDYNHGTGHGVGSFLNVHEGPHGINSRFGAANSSLPFDEGMIVSNEPGYYEDGNFGIRIESLLITKIANTPNKFNNKTYFGFENLTKIPICTKLCDTSLMELSEIKWLNDYNQNVYDTLKDHLSEGALKWLKKETTLLHKNN